MFNLQTTRDKLEKLNNGENALSLKTVNRFKIIYHWCPSPTGTPSGRLCSEGGDQEVRGGER